MVGGLHPTLKAEWYIDLITRMRGLDAALFIKAFTAVEIRHLAERVFKKSIGETLQILKDAGLQALTGGGAEIFDAGVRGDGRSHGVPVAGDQVGHAVHVLGALVGGIQLLADGAGFAVSNGAAVQRRDRQDFLCRRRQQQFVGIEMIVMKVEKLKLPTDVSGYFDGNTLIGGTGSLPTAIRQGSGEFVVHISDEAMAQKMHDCGKAFASNVSELAEVGLPLLIHGEVTHNHIDIFEREKVFLDTVLAPLVERHPTLRVVLEHITTGDAVDFVNAAPDRVAATITAHHLLFNRNHMLAGGIRPHFYCLPILKHGRHQTRLIEAATSGSPKFFLGTDSAPHAKGAKENACGCAGSYTAHAAIELYAEAFEAAGALDKLEGFASFFGPDFYRLPRHSDRITLVKASWPVPASYPFGSQEVVPVRAGESIAWQVQA